MRDLKGERGKVTRVEEDREEGIAKREKRGKDGIRRKKRRKKDRVEKKGEIQWWINKARKLAEGKQIIARRDKGTKGQERRGAQNDKE